MTTWEEAKTAQTSDEIRDDVLLPALEDQNVALVGWEDEAPQRGLVEGSARALAHEQELRAIVAYCAGPSSLLQLEAFLVSRGYTATAAATTAAAWIDATYLDEMGTPRLAATKATWSIPLKCTAAAAPITIDGTTRITLQAEDGTYFEAAATSTVTLNVGSSYKGTVTFAARVAGTTGNQIPGNITRVISGPAGLSVDTTETQVLLAPGRDAETNTNAIARAQARLGTLSGVLTAAGWKYVLQTEDVGGDPTLTRIFVDDESSAAEVAIIIATPVGAPTAEQLEAAQAQAARFRVAGTPTPVVSSAVEFEVEITAQILTDGTNLLATAQAETAVVQLGGRAEDWLYVDAVIAAIMGVPGVVNIVSLSLAEDVRRPDLYVLTTSAAVTSV